MFDPIQALQEQIRACRRCAFAHPVYPVVAGSAKARIMLVGQAPGKQEQLSGRGWTGPAGRRLVGWMTEVVGFASEERFRQQVYLAAVTRCFPGPSPGGKGDRRPSPSEIKRCGSWLDQELALVRPEIILLVGGLAIERFLGKARLDEVVGQVIPWDDALLIPLPHPSGASTWLNHPYHKAQLHQGLERFRDLVRARNLL
jgi:uracil-DNA glycosylase